MSKVKRILFQSSSYLVLLITANGVYRFMNELLFYILVVITLLLLLWQLNDMKKNKKEKK